MGCLTILSFAIMNRNTAETLELENLGNHVLSRKPIGCLEPGWKMMEEELDFEALDPGEVVGIC